jgi:hypothetical protein
MKYTVTILVLLMGVAAGAQSKKPTGPTHLKVRVAAKSYADSIVVRWAPMNPVAWLLGNDSGYRLARIDYSDKQHPVTTVLTATPLRPLTLEQMMATIGPNNKYAAIAAQALYGKDFQMTKAAPFGFAKKVKQAHDALNFRYSFTLEAADFSPVVASAIALRWVDKDVKKGSSYIYVLTVCGATKDYVVDSAAVFVADNPAAPVPAPDGLQGFGFDRRAEIQWNRRQAGNFSAFDIQRSDNEGKTWVALNKAPYYSPAEVPPLSGEVKGKKDTVVRKIAALIRDHQVFVDSLPQDYHRYLYRVRGINAFAEEGSWSAPIVVEGRDLTPPAAPEIDTARNTHGTQIRLVWSQRVASPDLAGYFISRANSVKGPFYPVTKYMLGKDVRVFVDSAAIPHLPNYYVVVAVDTAKNVAASGAFPGYLTDTIPPAAPVGLAGSIDSMGVVRLHWAVGREPDLKGYKVFFAYGEKDQYEQLTHAVIADTVFTDTISTKSLNRKVWYRVVAVDSTNNHSAYSAPLLLKKVKVVPPSAPVAGSFSMNGRGVAIEFMESRSEGAMGYEVARQTGSGGFVTVGRLAQDWTKRSLTFSDTVKANTDYYYMARTIDSTGVRSDWSVAVHVVRHAADSLAAPAGLQAKADVKGHRVRLSWQYKDTGDYFFVVYRAVNNGGLVAWQSFNKTALAGEDDSMGSGAYDYAIKVVHRDRAAMTAMSKTVHITIP